MKYRETLILALTFALAASVASAQAPVPQTAPGATSAQNAPPPLTAPELESLEEVLAISAQAAHELQVAELYLEAARRKKDAVVYFSQARRLRIAAKRGVDPDEWDLQVVTVKDETGDRQEWQWVRLTPPPKEKEKP